METAPLSGTPRPAIGLVAALAWAHGQCHECGVCGKRFTAARKPHDFDAYVDPAPRRTGARIPARDHGCGVRTMPELLRRRSRGEKR